MGLYINNKEHPRVFSQSNHLVEPNQVEFKRDYLSELIEQQVNATRNLQFSLNQIHYSQNDWNEHQTNQLRKLNGRLDELREFQHHQKTLDQQVDIRLENIENQHRTLNESILQEQHIHQDLFDQVNAINYSQKEIVSRIDVLNDEYKEIVTILKDYSAINEALITRLETVAMTKEKLEEQIQAHSEHNQQLVHQMTFIEEAQKDVLDRVDNNEGLIEKVMRQIDHLRSILFERTNDLEEKIEKVLQNSVTFFKK
ncbi:hypothetical protein ACH0B5_10825 [Ureibacillus sp. 179-F W5.1 NHS]|uniref:hypothetical protein n=1 Tax=Ureibacillus sp. 179-F W5.1 NHS TaxID=3374297 RepID=UPI003879DC25